MFVISRYINSCDVQVYVWRVINLDTLYTPVLHKTYVVLSPHFLIDAGAIYYSVH